MSHETKLDKDSYQKAEVEKIVEQTEDRMRGRFLSTFGEQVADLRRVQGELDVEKRMNEQSADTLWAIGRYTTKASHHVRWLFSKFHREFLTVDNFEEYVKKPRRDWPLIIVGVILLTTLFWYAQPANQIAAGQWYYSGYDAYFFWFGLLTVLVTFFWWRNKQTKKIQTGPF